MGAPVQVAVEDLVMLVVMADMAVEVAAAEVLQGQAMLAEMVAIHFYESTGKSLIVQ